MRVAELYLLSLILGILGAWMVSRFAGRLGLVDCPNIRSSHSSPTPRGGGIGIFAAFLVSSIGTVVPVVFWLPISALAILALLDDRIDLSPRLRLCVQMGIMVFFVVAAARLRPDLPWYLPGVVFWTVFIVGTANFYNFMDGINGIAGITGIVGFALLAGYIHSSQGQTPLSSIAVCISLSCLGFLPLNMPKAKVFMGDIGSILLGSLFGSLVYLASNTFLDFLCMASFLFPFYADELTTMAVRLKDGENLTLAHRRHLYQLLANEKQVPHWKVSVGFGLLQLFVGISIIPARVHGAIMVLVLLCTYFIGFTMISLYLRSSLESRRQR
jgi:Fuc2NAc and GlcNAc transferase